ncbi:MAG: DUF2064 domain-containing protein, partial [Candidatus Eisenbacteria bacterium]
SSVAPARTWWWIAAESGADDAPAVIAAAAATGLAPATVRLAVQQGAHLGERMEHALVTMLDEGPSLLVGADAPDAPLAAMLHAVALLGDDADRGGRPRLVLGPAHDGGFWLVGMDARPEGLLAGHAAWGTADVLDRTRAAATASPRGWETHAVEAWSDVDTGGDLGALEARLRAARARGEAGRPGWPARTAALVLAQGGEDTPLGG